MNDPVYNTVNEYKKQNQFSMTYNAGFNWEIVKGLTYQLKGSYAYTYNYTDNVWLKENRRVEFQRWSARSQTYG